jgi:hypothetical protein
MNIFGIYRGMQQFKITPDGFKKIRKRLLLRVIPLMLVAVTVGIFIASQNQSADALSLIIAIPFIAAAVIFGLYRGINRQKDLYESYILTLTDNLVRREQLNTPTISIYYNDIQEITKSNNGNFVIKGPDAKNPINVSAQIDNYVLLENELNQIKPITIKSSDSPLQKYQFLFVLLTLALMTSVYLVSNKIVASVSGVSLIGILSWSLVSIRTNKNIDVKTKRAGWVVLIVIASIIAIMYNKLTT